MRRSLLALLAGLLLYAGHPPIGIGAVGFVALVPLAALARDLEGARWRAGIGYGSLAGIAFFAPLLIWLTPFGYVAYVALVLVQALAVGAWTLLVAAWGGRRGRAVVAVVAWMGLESLRSTWPLGGFSWGALAYTQVDVPLVLGVARTLGGTGLGLVLATVAVAVEAAIAQGTRAWGPSRGTERSADVLFDAMRVPLLTVLGVLSLAVLLSGEAPAGDGRTLEVGIVQGGDTRATSAAGVARIDTGRIVRVTELMLEATQAFAADPPDLVVWPENSLDRDVRTEDGAPVRSLLEEALGDVAPAPILAGEIREGPRPGTLLNSMTLFTEDGIGDSYSKRHPVPFGEYVPARAALDWFPPLDQIPRDVVPGEGAQVVQVDGAAVGAVICFENTYAELARDQVRAGADLLVVSTNNSSYGRSAMSAQHVAFSRLRAVETGRWVVHAGISGISGFIDPDGGLHRETGLFRQATPRMEVPLLQGETLAVRLGDTLPVLLQVLTFGAVLALLADRLRHRS